MWVHSNGRCKSRWADADQTKLSQLTLTTLPHTLSPSSALFGRKSCIQPGGVYIFRNCSSFLIALDVLWTIFVLCHSIMTSWSSPSFFQIIIRVVGCLKRFCWFPWRGPHRIEYEICSKLVPSFCAKVMNSFWNGIFTLIHKPLKLQKSKWFKTRHNWLVLSVLQI